MKTHLHAKNSVKDFGGRAEDYIEIHEMIDSSKSSHADMRHRCVFHSAFGIYIIEKIFSKRGVDGEGNQINVPWIINSDGEKVHIRDIAEHHVMEDLGKIPALGDYLKHMELAQWMGGPIVKNKKFTSIEQLINHKID